MINHMWSIACEDVLVNPRSSNSSYINILNAPKIDNVNKKTGEIKLKPFMLVSKFHKTGPETEELLARFILESDIDGQKTTLSEHKETIEGETVFAELNLDITQMLIEKEGDYTLKISFKKAQDKRWKQAAALPFPVKAKKSLKAIAPKKEK